MSILKPASAALLTLVALTGYAAAQDDAQPTDAEPTCDTPCPVAQAEPAPPPPPPPAPPPPPPTYEPYQADMNEPESNMLERYGIEVALGGGIEGFASETLRDSTDPGGIWNVRVAFGTRSPLAFEAAYVGSAQSIDALGLDSDTILIGNGLEGKARLNLFDASIQPFAFAGLGWRRYSLTNNNFNTSAVDESDDILEIPFGAGVAYKYSGFVMDARAEYRLATEEDLMPSRNSDNAADMDRWSINANVGYAF